METNQISETSWPLWRKVLFRFFFIYVFLRIQPWSWLDPIPGVSSVTGYYDLCERWVVEVFNSYFFHVNEHLIYNGYGSGDTSYAWALTWSLLCISFIGSGAWSLVDRRRFHYESADYWLRTFLRYFIAMMSIQYGIIKILTTQMPHPDLSQLATPLGDLLPMRLSWLFIGYSAPYQIFSGVAELTAGLLLLNRKTVTFGLILAAGVFANVVMLNLSYDVPVKIFSIHLLFDCLFLLAYDLKRLLNFFLFNKPVQVTNLYQHAFTSRRFKAGRIIAKSIFILLAVWQVGFFVLTVRSRSSQSEKLANPIKRGFYDVKSFVFNGDTIPALFTDSVRWRDVVFESGRGSVGSTDTLFWQRYRRGYFSYKADTMRRQIRFVKSSWSGDTTYLFTLRYLIRDANSIRMWGKVRNDSLCIELEKSKRHFQLAEHQFHWISEHNR